MRARPKRSTSQWARDQRCLPPTDRLLDGPRVPIHRNTNIHKGCTISPNCLLLPDTFCRQMGLWTRAQNLNLVAACNSVGHAFLGINREVLSMSFLFQQLCALCSLCAGVAHGQPGVAVAFNMIATRRDPDCGLTIVNLFGDQKKKHVFRIPGCTDRQALMTLHHALRALVPQSFFVRDSSRELRGNPRTTQRRDPIPWHLALPPHLPSAAEGPRHGAERRNIVDEG